MMPLPQERTSVFAVPHEVTRNTENAHGKTYRVRCSTRRCSLWLVALFVVFIRGFHIDCFRCLFFCRSPRTRSCPWLVQRRIAPFGTLISSHTSPERISHSDGHAVIKVLCSVHDHNSENVEAFPYIQEVGNCVRKRIIPRSRKSVL